MFYILSHFSVFFSSSLTGRGTKEELEDKDETLNIFSLASGHLYERFLR
jgi:UDP-glucose:glycoprotein glucosyltransferase